MTGTPAILTPSQIVRRLDEDVVGQTQAKKVLAALDAELKPAPAAKKK